MVHTVDLCFFRYPAVLAVERHRYSGFQIPLPLFSLLPLHDHNAFKCTETQEL